MKNGLGNLAVRDVDQLAAIIKNRLKRIQYRPALIEGFLACTGHSPAASATTCRKRRRSTSSTRSKRSTASPEIRKGWLNYRTQVENRRGNGKMTTETPTATESGQEITVEEKISPLRELFVDAPEVRQGTLASRCVLVRARAGSPVKRAGPAY